MPENLCLSVSKHPCNTRHWWPTRLQRDLCFSNMQLGIIQLWYKATKHSIYNGACLFPPHFFTIFCQYDHQTCQQFNTHTHTPLLHFNISKNGPPSTLLLAWDKAVGCPVSLGICRSLNNPMSLPSARFPVQPGRRNWSSGLTTCSQARLRKKKK